MQDTTLRSPAAPTDPTLLFEEHRAALRGHCYRMLGSASEADDAVQETMVKAWRSFAGFEGRAALRTWLFRIATRVCLDALQERKRRARPMDLRPVGNTHEPLVALPGESWIEPIPDEQVVPASADPAEKLALRQSIRLAFVAALQHLPARQRAALLLTEVCGESAAEAAATLEMTVPALNSALQRARSTLATRDVQAEAKPLSETQSELIARYVDAFERYDMEALTKVLRDDATMCMPPFDLWLQGPETIAAWMLGRGAACRGSRLVPTSACGSPAFGQYKPGAPGEPFTPWALVVVEPDGDRIGALHFFLDTEKHFPRFGLPASLPA